MRGTLQVRGTLPAAADWGTVPGWVGAVGTVLAFGLALGLGVWELRQRRMSQRDDQLRQARLITISEPAMDVAERDRNRESVYVRLFNYSDQPIHEIYVMIRLWRESDSEPAEPDMIQIILLGPGENHEFEFELPPGDGPVLAGAPWVWFLDAYGRRWQRNAVHIEPQRLLHYMPPGFPIEQVKQLRGAASDTGWSRDATYNFGPVQEKIKRLRESHPKMAESQHAAIGAERDRGRQAARAADPDDTPTQRNDGDDAVGVGPNEPHPGDP